MSTKANRPQIGPKEQFMGIQGASGLLGVSCRVVRDNCAAGTLPHYSKNGRLFFLESELRAFIDGDQRDQRARRAGLATDSIIEKLNS